MTMRPLDPFELPLFGTQLIEASAGTGKTYTITSIVLRLLLERGLTIDEVVVVTFTKAATFELRDRIRRRIDDAERAFRTGVAAEGDALLAGLLEKHQDRQLALSRLRAAQRGLDHAAVFTIHGFAQRMLQEHAFESGARFDLELVGDQRALVTEVAIDFWAREVATLPKAIWRLLAGRVRPASFVALGYVAAAFPDLPLHGAGDADDADLSRGPLAALSRLEEARLKLSEVYRREGADALRMVRPPSQNSRYYAPERVSDMKAALEKLIAEREPRSLPSPLEFLTEEKLVRHTNKGHTPPKHALFDAIDAIAAALDEARVEGENFLDHLRARMVAFARKRIVLEHQHAGTQSFDDLLHGLCHALRQKSGPVLARRIRERYPVALIDEFQDTDPTQYDIFRRIYAAPDMKGDAKPALFLIGDPKQAIYAFRGADVFAYIAAAKDAAGQAHTLTTNFRSDPGLLTALNTVFGRTPQPFMIDSIAYSPVAAPSSRKDRLFRGPERVTPLELLYLDRATADVGTGKWQAQSEWMFIAAQEIARLLEAGLEIDDGNERRRIEPRDIAVLTRTNVQAQTIQQHLRTLRIPSVLAGDRTVFETDEADELAALMRAMAEPASPSGVKTALSTRFLDVGGVDISLLTEDEATWERWVGRFQRCHALWAQDGFVHAIQHLFRELDVVSLTLTLVEGERRLTNVRHLIELLHAAETEQHLGVVGLLQWFDQARSDKGNQGMAPEAQQLRLESDADAVTLTTMHKSKGLEYPIVVLPSLGVASDLFPSDRENLRFHNPKASGRLELDVRVPAHKQEAIEIGEHEHRAEVLRLAYVALTRAKHHAIVLWGGTNPAFSALGYLLHQPAGELGGLEVDITARLKALDDGARWAELERLAASSAGTIGLRRATLDAGPRFEPKERVLPELDARALTRPIPQGVRASSFSAMTRTASHSLSPHARAGRDVDEVASARSADERALASVSLKEVTLAAFPRGATPGELLHAVFENSPFAEGTADERAVVAERELRRHGFDATHLPALTQAVEEVLSTPLDDALSADAGAEGSPSDGPSWSLGALSKQARVAEMEFVLPVAGAGRAPSNDARADGNLLTARRLARALEVEEPAVSRQSAANAASGDALGASAPWDRDYLRQVEQLEFSAWSGFLRGFIDLVFERDGRFYVLDYKSNHLGNTLDDYRPEQLRGAMAEHHYYLQYLFYSVALHRYLGQRIAGYEYETHFGGVYYLFVRGMHPESRSRRGVFFHRPSRALIDSLSALFDDPASVETDGASEASVQAGATVQGRRGRA